MYISINHLFVFHLRIPFTGQARLISLYLSRRGVELFTPLTTSNRQKSFVWSNFESVCCSGKFLVLHFPLGNSIHFELTKELAMDFPWKYRSFLILVIHHKDKIDIKYNNHDRLSYFFLNETYQRVFLAFSIIYIVSIIIFTNYIV